MQKDWGTIVVVVVITTGVLVWSMGGLDRAQQITATFLMGTQSPSKNLYFSCTVGGGFQALFYTQNVHLHLGDGTDLIVSRISSTTYATADTSVVFIYQGGTATIEKGPNHSPLYSDCAAGTNNYS